MVKDSLVNAGNLGLILGLGRSPGEGNGNLRQYSFLFLINILFVCLFLAVLGLHCFARAFSSCGVGVGLLFVVVHRLRTVVASLAAEHRLRASVAAAGRLSSCSSQALKCKLSSWGIVAPWYVGSS